MRAPAMQAAKFFFFCIYFCFRSFVDKVRIAQHSLASCDFFCKTLLFFFQTLDFFFSVDKIFKRHIYNCIGYYYRYCIFTDTVFVFCSSRILRRSSLRSAWISL